MANCSLSKESSVLASEFIWSDAPAGRLVMLVTGIVLSATTFAGYFYLIWSYRRRNAKFNAQFGTFALSPKTQFQESFLILGPVMTTFFLVQLCFPELASMANLIQVTYRAYAYLYLMQYAGCQLGQINHLVRENGSGMLQSQPTKIWNKPPCWCLGIFLKERILSRWDGAIMYWLIYQWCIIGPLMSALQMVAHYEGFSAANTKVIEIISNVLEIISLKGAVYGTNVMCGMVEAALPIQYQVRQRPWFSWGQWKLSEEQLLTVKRTNNITIKNTWLTIVAVLPSVTSLIASFAVNDGLCEHGRTLGVEDYKNYLVAFISILLNFLGVLFAFAKAFRLSDDSDRTELLEQICSRCVEMELWPGFALEVANISINGILTIRKNEGVDSDFGLKPSAQWLEAFGEPGGMQGNRIFEISKVSPFRLGTSDEEGAEE